MIRQNTSWSVAWTAKAGLQIFNKHNMQAMLVLMWERRTRLTIPWTQAPIYWIYISALVYCCPYAVHMHACMTYIYRLQGLWPALSYQSLCGLIVVAHVNNTTDGQIPITCWNLQSQTLMVDLSPQDAEVSVFMCSSCPQYCWPNLSYYSWAWFNHQVQAALYSQISQSQQLPIIYCWAWLIHQVRAALYSQISQPQQLPIILPQRVQDINEEHEYSDVIFS